MEEKLNILHVDTLFDDVINEGNQKAIEVLRQEFKRKHYPNVNSKSKQLQNDYPNDRKLLKALKKINVISHAEIGEFQKSKEMIQRLYDDSSDKDYHHYMVLA